MPHDEDGVAELHQALLDCLDDPLGDGWGEVSSWPSDRITEGDWTPAIWRSPELAQMSSELGNSTEMNKMSDYGITPKKTGPSIKASELSQTKAGLAREIPIMGSKGAESQKKIKASPDRYWTPTTEIGREN